MSNRTETKRATQCRTGRAPRCWARRPTHLLVASLGASLLACGTPADPPPPAAPAPPARFIVFGIDRSGSYDFVKVGLNEAALKIAEASAGDTVVVRWISDASFLNRELVTRIELDLEEPLADCSGNVFDGRCRRKRSAQLAQLTQIQRQHVNHLLALRPSAASHTDIFGFLQAASDLFAEAPAEAERLLYLATDLQDNVGYEVDPNLSGAHVQVIALQTAADPQATLRLRKRWQERFASYGASDVSFTTSEASQ